MNWCIVTLVALAWLFSSVYFHVSPQTTGLRLCIVTLVTFVWLSSTVCFQMSPQCIFLWGLWGGIIHHHKALSKYCPLPVLEKTEDFSSQIVFSLNGQKVKVFSTSQSFSGLVSISLNLFHLRRCVLFKLINHMSEEIFNQILVSKEVCFKDSLMRTHGNS